MPSAPSSLSPSITASGSLASRSISSGSTSSTRNVLNFERNASPFSTAAGSFLGCGWIRSSRRLPRKSSLPKLGFSQPCSRALSATCRASFSLTLLATDDSLRSREYLSRAGVSLITPGQERPLFPADLYIIRLATEQDAATVRHLAALDSARPLTGRVLIG